jgi:hypothetical protein
MTGQILSAAGKAAVGPDLIYAMKKTGRIVTESNQHLLVVLSIRLPGSLGVSLPCRKRGQDDLVVLAARRNLAFTQLMLMPSMAATSAPLNCSISDSAPTRSALGRVLIQTSRKISRPYAVLMRGLRYDISYAGGVWSLPLRASPEDGRMITNVPCHSPG